MILPAVIVIVCLITLFGAFSCSFGKSEELMDEKNQSPNN